MNRLTFLAFLASVAAVPTGLWAQTNYTAQISGKCPRLVVANFRSGTGDTIYWADKKESAAMWAGTLADKLNQRFIQSRRFTVIDRKFDAEVKDELARLSDKNAAKADMIRMGQRLGIDYMLVGEIRFASSQAPAVAVHPITGQRMAAAPQQFAEINYRLILAPTGEIKMADSVCLGYEEFQVADVFSFVSASTDAAALLVSESVTQGLFAPPAAAAPAVAPAAAQPAVSAPTVPANELNTTIRATGNGGIVAPF